MGAKLAAGHVPPLLKPLAAWGARSVVLPRTVAHLCLWRRFGKPTPSRKILRTPRLRAGDPATVSTGSGKGGADP